VKDLAQIIWPRQRDSRHGSVSDQEAQVVFNRSAMFAATIAMICRVATAEDPRTGTVAAWIVLVVSFAACVAWGRSHYRRTGSKLPGRVLVVEDDLATREILARAIRSRGWDVDQADDLRSAVALLERNPCVVIVDVGLPDGCGLDLFAHLPAGRLAPRTVVLTGASDPGVLARIVRVAPSNVIYKPIASVDSLLDSLGDPIDPDRERGSSP
jgi:ActR/RegA family two-component response regulator